MSSEDQGIGDSLPDICKEFGTSESGTLSACQKIREVFCDAKPNCDAGTVFASRRIRIKCEPGAADTAQYCVAEDDFQNIAGLIDSYSKIRDGAKEHGASAREIAVLDVFEYMILVESVYSFNVNRLCYLLVNTNRRVDGYFSKKHGMRSITRDSALWKKLKLLRTREFSDLADACDTDLRNAAAHVSFELEEGERIRIRRRSDSFDLGKTPTDIKCSRTKLLRTSRLYCAAFELCSTGASLRQSKR